MTLQLVAKILSVKQVSCICAPCESSFLWSSTRVRTDKIVLELAVWDWTMLSMDDDGNILPGLDWPRVPA
jgi:hypothetical protein